MHAVCIFVKFPMLQNISDKMGKKLFDEFPPVSTEQWEELIRTDLKGADYEKKLIWKTPEGIPLRPYYRQEDIRALGHVKSLPGEFPWVRGKKTGSNEWLVRQDIVVNDVGAANARAIDSLMKGAGSIGFIPGDNLIQSGPELGRLLRNICLASAEINFVTQRPSEKLVRLIDEENASRGGARSDLHGSVGYDPLGVLLTTGNYPVDEEEAFDLAVNLVYQAAGLPDFTVINVDASIFHNAGGSAVQDIAFAISSAVQYMDRLTAKGIKPEQAAEKIRFTFAAGSNYFMEMAKFRAVRYLWAKITEAWGVSHRTAGKLFIHAVTSRWNKTIYDPYVNVLRSTTESMSAVLGGIDSLCVDPFDKTFKKECSDFSERVARNIQLILKEEAYFDKVADPSAGSYYIENLTASLIEESWKLFLKTDDMGGFIEAFKSGVIQDMIEETAAGRDRYIAGRRDTLVGTNKYPDPRERVAGNIDRSVAWPVQQVAENPVGRPLKLYRGAMAFEEIRIRTEMHPAGPPKVFLLTYGNPAMRKARAVFASGFFGCAGFEVINNQGFKTPSEGAEAALKEKADIVVVCSSDEEYPEIVPAVAAEIGKSAMVAVAGYPRDSIEQIRAAGVDIFIHLGSDVPGTLQHIQEELGIR